MRAAEPRKSKKPSPKFEEHLKERRARIERIKMEIAEGTYQPDALEVSRAIVRKSILQR